MLTQIEQIFTFQDGDIQIDISTIISICRNSFTFQDGDIQISKIGNIEFSAVTFTFQSGDIQIQMQVAHYIIY